MCDGLASQTHAGYVDLRHFSGQAMAREAKTVGAKGVGFQNLSARLQILLVNRQDQAWVGKIQLIVATVDEDAAGVEHGPHGAVGKHGAAGKDVSQLSHSLDMVRQPGQPSHETGALCYTSVVISWLETGSGPQRVSISEPFAFCLIDRVPPLICSRSGSFRVLRRGMGF